MAGWLARASGNPFSEGQELEKWFENLEIRKEKQSKAAQAKALEPENDFGSLDQAILKMGTETGGRRAPVSLAPPLFSVLAELLTCRI